MMVIVITIILSLWARSPFVGHHEKQTRERRCESSSWGSEIWLNPWSNLTIFQGTRPRSSSQYHYHHHHHHKNLYLGDYDLWSSLIIIVVIIITIVIITTTTVIIILSLRASSRLWKVDTWEEIWKRQLGERKESLKWSLINFHFHPGHPKALKLSPQMCRRLESHIKTAEGTYNLFIY